MSPAEKKAKLDAIRALVSEQPNVVKPALIETVVQKQLNKKPKFQLHLDSIPGGRRG